MISCVVPVYNGERYLKESLDSILAQTHRPAEIIVVDDGSTDATADIVSGYGDDIVYVRQTNAGPGAARNRGIGLAMGKFIAFQDADDLWHEDKLDRQLAFLEAHPEVGVCITHVKNFWIPELGDENAALEGHRFMQAQPGYTCQAALARREIFDEVGLFDVTLRIGEDLDWFGRVRESGVRIGVLPEVLVSRRLHDQNLTREFWTRGREDLLNVVAGNLLRKRR